jgi:glycosyltransferase involved in cell wall biosynthesis
MGIIERFLYKKSDLIIGTMPGLGEHVNNNRLKSPLKSKINVVCIPLGVNLELREKTEKNSLIDISSYCHKNQLKIVYSGSIGISNALDNFFRLVVLFQNDNSVKFFILGDGPLLTQYQVKTRSYKNLVYLGKVPSLEVTSVLKQADILYLSNKPFKLWEYGQSLNKLIDYMYAGKIILMEYTGLISMINDSKSGFIVPYRNSSHMQDIIKYVGQLSENERDQIGSKGKDWLLNNQSYQILANKLYNHLKQL